MLRTDNVREALKDNGKPMSYDAIWSNVKSNITESLGTNVNEEQVKADLYFSLMEDSRLIMIGNGLWDLKEKYSLENQEIIEKAIITEEVELVWEESEETKELNLKIVDLNDDDE